jgi:translation initiation factor 6 (eIF-6)
LIHTKIFRDEDEAMHDVLVPSNSKFVLIHAEMEAEKLQRLHDTLSKLAPRGRVGGLGLGGLGSKAAAARDAR